MATTAGRNHCIICGKEKATVRCGGCLQEFCFNHFQEHRQELSKQLDEVEVNCDRLRQTFNENTTDSQKHASIEQIDNWEREAIKKVQQTAEEERQKLLKYTIEHKRQIEADFNELTDQLRESREENDFYETDLHQWNEKLRKLTEELAKPLNTDLQFGSAFINKISLDITSETPLVPNSDSSIDARNGRDGFGGGSGTFGSTNDNNSREEYYNCNKTDHMSRECPEARKENHGGGFSSGGGDRNSNFTTGKNGETSSISVTVRNTRNQNSDDQDDNGDAKPAFHSWRSNTGGGSNNGYDSEDSKRRTTLNTAVTRGSFNSGGGFRGGRGRGRGRGKGFSPINRGDAGGGNCYNCNSPDHQYHDCPEASKPRDGGGRKNDRTSDDIFDQAGGRASAQLNERYIPPPPPTTEDDIFGEAVPKGENFGKHYRTQVRCIPAGKLKPIELYEEANLATQMLSNIRRAHFEEPTPIQRYIIPCIRQHDDIIACTQTGTDKTAAFLVPIISNLLEYHWNELSERHHPPSPLCLILSPTRELALQTECEARKFAYQTAVIPGSVVRGPDKFSISDRLREGCHILSATAGRLNDMVVKGRISLKQVKYFVLDEADRMLDTGFEPDIRTLEDLGLPLKDERCTSIFLGTYPDEVPKLAKHFLRDNYIFLAVGANEDISQTIEEVRQADKKDRLCQLLKQNLKSERCLIFVETKRLADYIGVLLSQKNLMCTTILDDRTQKQRSEALRQFTNGQCPILVATSGATRDLDIPSIGCVVNYDLPDSSDFDLHRIGRTDRAGHLGKSISFFDPDWESDRKIVPDLISKLSEAGQEVPEFLKRYANGSNAGYNGRNTPMRLGSNNIDSRNHPTSPSVRTPSADAVEEHWN